MGDYKQVKERIRLNEVTRMRCELTILIVFMHAFTCYDHRWRAPEGFIDIPAYKWMARISFAFTLEVFVFISGYLFAFQRITLNKITSFWALVAGKLKRLMLPSVIFSTAYFAIFYHYKGMGNMFYSIINGCGHLWFLPMLFWCFLGGWLLEKIKVHDVWKMAFLVSLNIFALISLPLQLRSAASFMVYFYAGFVVYKHKDAIWAAITPKRLLLGWIMFAVIFVVLRPMRDVLACTDDVSKLVKLTMLIGNKACQLVYASLGVMVFYCTAVYYTQRHQLKPFTIKLASCCFGIYLFQQFILQLLYYKTSFPVIVGPYWLPWCGFVIAVIVSYLLSALLLRTKTGRFLIG